MTFAQKYVEKRQLTPVVMTPHHINRPRVQSGRGWMRK